MAETKLHNYTVQEKLNKMDVDLIDVTVTPDGTAYTAGDVFFVVTEIPNAVAVNGGTAILQSVSAIGTSDRGTDGLEVGAFDLILTSDVTPLTDAGGGVANDAASALTNAIAVMDGTLGKVSITNMTDVGVCMIGDKKNIGMVCKAASGTKSLYVWGIAQSSDDLSLIHI